jgi:hypothetical protein
MCFVVVKNEFDIRTVHITDTIEGSEFYKEFEKEEDAEAYKGSLVGALNESKVAKLRLVKQLIDLHSHTTEQLGQHMTKTPEEGEE